MNCPTCSNSIWESNGGWFCIHCNVLIPHSDLFEMNYEERALVKDCMDHAATRLRAKPDLTIPEPPLDPRDETAWRNWAFQVAEIERQRLLGPEILKKY